MLQALPLHSAKTPLTDAAAAAQLASAMNRNVSVNHSLLTPHAHSVMDRVIAQAVQGATDPTELPPVPNR